MKTRPLTKLEARLLGLTPSERSTMDEVLTGGQVHPQQFRSGVGRRYELLGMGRGRIVEVLSDIGIGRSDISFGNDSPRGGAEGKWLKLSATGRSKAQRRLA